MNLGSYEDALEYWQELLSTIDETGRRADVNMYIAVCLDWLEDRLGALAAAQKALRMYKGLAIPTQRQNGNIARLRQMIVRLK